MNEFLWAVSTSAFQVEGAYLEDGKGLTTADIRCEKKKGCGTSVASDSYHHVEEDVALLKELGVKAYRFSISWARIYPKGNDADINEAGVAYYRKLIQELKKNQIEPIVTLLHFDVPMGIVEEYGGFVSRKAVDDFTRYAETIFTLFGKEVKYFLTINEQNVMSISANMQGIEEADTKKRVQMLQTANYHMYLANAEVTALCHKLCPHAIIGPAVSYPTLYPATCDPQDVYAAYRLEELMAFAPMDIYVHGEYPVWYLNYLKDKGITLPIEEGDDEILKRGKPDYLGVNWYCTNAVKAGTNEAMTSLVDFAYMQKNPHLSYTEWGWSYDPLGFYMALRKCYDRYHLPVMITENGWSSREELVDQTVHDEKRSAYLIDHTNEMMRAMQDGVAVIGYCVWSFIDLMSSGDGFEKRYGLVYVDRNETDVKECKRYKKDSFYTYQRIIEENS